MNTFRGIRIYLQVEYWRHMFNMLWYLSGIVIRLVVKCVWVRIYYSAVFVKIIIIINIIIIILSHLVD
jgi:hypothetical protein